MVDQILPQYLYRKRGVYYFSRRIPLDLQDEYDTSRIVASLRTKSVRTAKKSATCLSNQLEEYWATLRVQKISSRFTSRPTAIATESDRKCGYKLSDARDVYLKLKGTGKPVTFQNAATRNCQYAIDCIGDKDLTQYRSDDGARFRDHLVSKELSGASIKRIFSTLKSMVNLISSEYGLEVRNPFVGVYLPDLSDSKDRKPIPLDTIKVIQRQCKLKDDDLRWLVALISDTGMRLAEDLR